MAFCRDRLVMLVQQHDLCIFRDFGTLQDRAEIRRIHEEAPRSLVLRHNPIAVQLIDRRGYRVEGPFAIPRIGYRCA
ncbi:hypothetical protein D3C78_1543710 [compost metagenome]